MCVVSVERPLMSLYVMSVLLPRQSDWLRVKLCSRRRAQCSRSTVSLCQQTSLR